MDMTLLFLYVIVCVGKCGSAICHFIGIWQNMHAWHALAGGKRKKARRTRQGQTGNDRQWHVVRGGPGGGQATASTSPRLWQTFPHFSQGTGIFPKILPQKIPTARNLPLCSSTTCTRLPVVWRGCFFFPAKRFSLRQDTHTWGRLCALYIYHRHCHSLISLSTFLHLFKTLLAERHCDAPFCVAFWHMRGGTRTIFSTNKRHTRALGTPGAHACLCRTRVPSRMRRTSAASKALTFYAALYPIRHISCAMPRVASS